ncbi:phospholipid/glycerol acyltransferase [Emticicia oligotrophica DSM 17448]|uniref:Phospholipid/glycerol acyltransferase n=1 Tax=Emticicia oligotrophica (strain DSM 17448 / CIP 109782 / MTCC 6937 / GPTSA100-15) TaxID=929562 RepID=A0ABM5MZZ6_EMTOG|nr:lysophospholipid acyltransferase family protein [Emticicia oligotrophica]AFK02714.1 phospholipid/glycerol acyltransferase [Emticicia oligotrophica DSM 17448]
MKIFSWIYTIWCAFWFLVVFLLLYPIVYVALQKENWKPIAHYCNRIWGKIFFFMIGQPVKVSYEVALDPKRAYVFCANHFSYIDIAMMGVVVKNYFAFMGKSSVKKVPLFGYMFTKLHIQVDRAAKDSRIKALTRSIKALKAGRSIMIFPEGGIHSTNFPEMVQPFKDGAFSMAIENQVPIVPISLLDNYKMMPDVLIKWHKLRVIVHKPIETTGMTKADMDTLKKQVYDVIQPTLNKYKAD